MCQACDNASTAGMGARWRHGGGCAHPDSFGDTEFGAWFGDPFGPLRASCRRQRSPSSCRLPSSVSLKRIGRHRSDLWAWTGATGTGTRPPRRPRWPWPRRTVYTGRIWSAMTGRCIGERLTISVTTRPAGLPTDIWVACTTTRSSLAPVPPATSREHHVHWPAAVSSRPRANRIPSQIAGTPR